MDAIFPGDPHFPVKSHTLAAYAPFFANGDSFANYVSHLHVVERLLDLPSGVRPEVEKGIIRGAKKGSCRKEGPRFLKSDVLRLIGAALGAGHVHLARLFAVARTWMLRVRDELLPLQWDGRRGLDPGDTRWHSQVIVLQMRPRPRLKIVWRTRKNAQQGDEAVRVCSCDRDPASRVLCGVCALLGQAAERQRAAAPLTPPCSPAARARWRRGSSRTSPGALGCAHSGTPSAAAWRRTCCRGATPSQRSCWPAAGSQGPSSGTSLGGIWTKGWPWNTPWANPGTRTESPGGFG